MISVFAQDWLKGLFGDPELAELWSAEAQLAHFIAFEAELAIATEAAGGLPEGQGKAAAKAIRAARISPDDLVAGTAQDGVPVPALVRILRQQAEDASAGVHPGATSQDVMDTALSITLQAVTPVLVSRLQDVVSGLDRLGDTYGTNRLMARTRMQAAMPFTVADRIEAWRAPLAAQTMALKQIGADIGRLQLGGAVGNRQAMGEHGPAIAANMAEALGLHDCQPWHSDRTMLADYANRLAVLSGALGKIGQDIVLMAQQGIEEIGLAGGGGSSAMPHKANPVLAELLVTLARFNATQVAGIHHALVHEQERSGAAWMLEWMILPQMTMATGRALTAARSLCGQITQIGATD